MTVQLKSGDFTSGGLVLFSGGTNPAKAGVGAILSLLIEKITGSKLSHSAMVMPSEYWLGGVPWIVESTEWRGVSGPQYNVLEERLNVDYVSKGGHAVYLPFADGLNPNWAAVWKSSQDMFALVKAKRIHYSVKRLFADATARNFAFALLPVAGILNWMAENDHGMVCSECCAMLMTDGGIELAAKQHGIQWLPKVKPIPGVAIGCAPQDLFDMPLYKTLVTLA